MEKAKKKIAAVKERITNRREKQPDKNTVSQNRLELLVAIVNRSKTEYFLDLIQSFDVNMQSVVLAHGTADAKMLELFGLNNSDKSVIFGVIQEDKIPEAFAALDDKFKTIKNGKGIAYTVPLTGVIGTLIFGFLSNNRMVKGEQEK